MAATTPLAASPAVAPALLDSLAASSGELDPHGLEDMQPIDHTAVVPSEPPVASVSPTAAIELAADEAALAAAPFAITPETSQTDITAPPLAEAAPPAQTSTPWHWADEPATTPTEPIADAATAPDVPATDATATHNEPVADTPAAPEAPAETNWWGWAAAGAAGVAGATVAAAALHHNDTPPDDAPAVAETAAVVDVPEAPPAAQIATESPTPGLSTYVPSWATTPEDAPAPIAPESAPYVPWGYSDALSTTLADASVGEAPAAPYTPSVESSTAAPTPRRYAWELDDEDEPANADLNAQQVPAAEAPPADETPAAAESESDQLGAWTRFADSVSPGTLAQASSAFAGWSAAQTATETDPLPSVAPPPEPEVSAPVAAAITPPTHPAPSPFVGQSISAHTERSYEPNMPPPSARSKTPSRPLGNNPFFNRIRDLLGTTAEPSAALGTIVLPRHMYPQHSYSILVRLQTRAGTEIGGDKRMAIVEVEAPANAFYLPVRRLALPIPADGGLSEGTLSITALRPSTSNSDRIIFTFKQTDGVVLHKGAYVADVSILTAQQIANGEPMITLVHPLDIPA